MDKQDETTSKAKGAGAEGGPMMVVFVVVCFFINPLMRSLGMGPWHGHGPYPRNERRSISSMNGWHEARSTKRSQSMP